MVVLGLSTIQLEEIEREVEEWKMVLAMKTMTMNVERERKKMMMILVEEVCFW